MIIDQYHKTFVFFVSRLIQESELESGHLEEVLKNLCSLFNLTGQNTITADFLKNESLDISKILGPGAEQKMHLTFVKVENFCQKYNFAE